MGTKMGRVFSSVHTICACPAEHIIDVLQHVYMLCDVHVRLHTNMVTRDDSTVILHTHTP